MTQEERQELLVLLQNHSNLRTGQDQVLWSIFGAFWTANSLLLVSIFTSGDQWNTYVVGLIVSIIGFSISWVWTYIQKRALHRIEKYELAIKTIEEKLQLDNSLCAFFESGSAHYLPAKRTARYIMKKFSICFAYFWLILSLVFLGCSIYRFVDI